MNLANKLTMLRVILVPIFIFFMAFNSFYSNIAALIVFTAAAITDFFDGRIARKQNTVTTFGIFLDPLADKLLVTSAFVSFVAVPSLNIPAWMAIFIISREFLITGLRSLAASQNIIIPASKSGKFKTTSQITAIITILVIMIINSTLVKFFAITRYDLIYMQSWKGSLGWILMNLPFWLMFIVTLLTIYSGVVYIINHKNIFTHNKK